MTEEVEIWFPNYRNNPGIIAKELINQVEKITKHFGANVIGGKFHGYERFILNLEVTDEAYIDYVKKQIYHNLGTFQNPNNLNKGDMTLGRVYSPGKVGFGIFVDIGIRTNDEQNDALLPLYKLREDLGVEDLSTREIVKMLGLVDGYPLLLQIDEIDCDDKNKIDVSLAESQIEQYLDWGEKGKDRLIITKTLRSNVSNQLNKLKFSNYIDEITSIDPLTTVVTCSSKTNASGLVPKLGSRLRKSPIGIFHP